MGNKIWMADKITGKKKNELKKHYILFTFQCFGTHCGLKFYKFVYWFAYVFVGLYYNNFKTKLIWLFVFNSDFGLLRVFLLLSRISDCTKQRSCN